MEAGTCFLLTDKDVDNHLWVILSEPSVNEQKVLVVNLTTATARKERVCLLQPGDHPWVRHETCVNYADSFLTTKEQLLEWKHKGLLKVTDPMPEAVLERIRNAALDSTRMPLENADVLIDQGLVDDEE
jgi:hypothetical protein